jgi:hypothetical protein
MRVISKSNASGVTLGGVAYEPGPDGVFDFPEPVGVELTTKHASMWVAEAAHLAAMSAAEVERLRDPNALVPTVAELLGRVAALEAKLTGGEHAAASEPDAPKPAKKTVAKKTAPAKPQQSGDAPPA